MSFDEQSYKDYLHNTVQSEDYYWSYIDEIQKALLLDKEKPKYAPTLDFVNEVLRDKKEKGLMKMLALRLLGSSVLPQSDNLPVNTDFVTRLLKHKQLLEVINETCQFRADVQDDKRGGTMFKDDGKEIGEAHLRYSLELIKMLATTWEKTKTKSGDQVPTQFYVIYHQLLDAGVKFPDRFEYFEEVKKKNKSSKSDAAAAAKPQAEVSSAKQQPTPQATANTSSTPGGPSKIDLIQIYRESYNLIESILHIVNDNLKIEDFVREAIEGQESAFNDELQTLTNILNTQSDAGNQSDVETLWKAYYFYQELTQTIIQLSQKNYAEKTYKAFRKNLLHQAEEFYPTLWIAPEPPTQSQSFPPQNAFDTKPQAASAIPNDNNDPWGGGASDFGGFGFNNNAEKSKPADEGFGGNFGGFNFEEQKQQDDQEEQRRKAQRQQEEKIAADLVGSQRNKGANHFDNDQQELDRQMKSFGFGGANNNNDQGGFGGGFSDGFDVKPLGGANNNNNNNMQNNSGGFGGFNNFDTVQEPKKEPKPEKKETKKQFNNEEFTYQPPAQNYFYNEPAEREQSPDFTRPASQSNQQPAQQSQQQPSKREPANPKEKQVSFQENSQFYVDNNKNSYYNNSDSKRNTDRAGMRESFVEFSELSKSDISASDFPLRNTIINEKEYRGRLHGYNREIFQVLQDYNLTQQIVRRFKIANLKLKSPLIQSTDFEVGVISERIFDSNSSRYLIKTDLFLGNKTLYPVENFTLEFEGDYTSNLYIKNDSFPEVIEANKQLKVQCVMSYSKTPYSLINGSVTGRINGQDFQFTVFLPNLLPRYINFIDASNHMQYFRSKWRQKRDQIIKSDTFALNKRVIRTPVYFKRYFPQFSENMSLDEFISHNKANQAAPINYKLRGTIELDIQTIQYMIKIIVRPNFTAVIQVIPFSGYINTAEALIDHFVFLFGTQ